MGWILRQKWLVICFVFLFTGSSYGIAQEPVKIPPLPGITVKSCEIQGAMVAQLLGLTASQTNSLIEAYMRAREGAMGTHMQIAQYTGLDYRYIRQRLQEDRDKLDANLRKFLSSEQSQKAIVLLGGFFRRWDAMAMILDGMSLEPKVRTEAIRSLLRYVAESDPIIQEANSSSELETARGKVVVLKQNLDSELSKILTEEQMNKWIKGTERSNRNPPSERRRGGRPESHWSPPESTGADTGG